MADYELHPEDAVIRSEAERYLFAEFHIGADLEEFLASKTGQYLKGVAEQEIGEAIRAFLNHDLTRNRDLVAHAQVKAQRSRQSFQWMLEAVLAGRAAEHQLREMDDYERQ